MCGTIQVHLRSWVHEQRLMYMYFVLSLSHFYCFVVFLFFLFFFFFHTTLQFLSVSGEDVGCPVLFVRVGDNGLPRGATVEWHFVAVATPHTPQCRYIIIIMIWVSANSSPVHVAMQC